jgi:hypothetical protein
VWVGYKAFGLFLPAGADELIGSEAGESLETLGEVVSVEEGGEVFAQLGVIVVVIGAHGGFLDGAVHAFDLAVGPGMVGLGEAMLDAMAAAGPVERMSSQQGRGALAVLGQIGELDAVIGEHGVDPVRHRLDQGVEEGRGGFDVGPLDELGKSELGRAIHRDEKVELALGGADFGEIDVEVADGIGLELLLSGGKSALEFRQAADAVARQAPVQRRASKLGMVACRA